MKARYLFGGVCFPVAMMKLYYAILIRHELSPRDHMFRLDTRKKCKLFLKVKLESIIARFAELKNVL